MQNPPYNPYAPPPSGKKIVVIILVIVAVMIALLIFGGVALFRSFSGTTKAAAAPAEQFLDALQRHDFTAAEALMTTDAQAATPASSLKNMDSLIEKQHGPMTGHSGSSNWNVNSYNGVTTVSLTYTAHSQKGEAPISIVMAHPPEGWRVQRFEFSL